MIEYLLLWAFYTVIFVSWIFFFLHAMQRIEDPKLRTKWFIAFFLFNILCVIAYYFKTYKNLEPANKKLLKVR